jgi:hypothetical protein
MSLTSERVRGMAVSSAPAVSTLQASVPAIRMNPILLCAVGFCCLSCLRTDQREHDRVFTLLSPSNPVRNGNSAQRWGAKEKRS